MLQGLAAELGRLMAAMGTGGEMGEEEDKAGGSLQAPPAPLAPHPLSSPHLEMRTSNTVRADFHGGEHIKASISSKRAFMRSVLLQKHKLRLVSAKEGARPAEGAKHACPAAARAAQLPVCVDYVLV